MANDLEQPVSRTARTSVQLGITEPLFQLVDAFTPFSPEQNRAVYGILVLVIVFVMNLVEKKSDKHLLEKAVPTKGSEALKPEV